MRMISEGSLGVVVVVVVVVVLVDGVSLSTEGSKLLLGSSWATEEVGLGPASKTGAREMLK